MCQSKQRVSATKRLINHYPHCCFCGGNQPAETRDHLPPTVFFDGNHRPEDIVVPACTARNVGSRESDRIAAFYSRIGFAEPTRTQRTDFQKLSKAIRENNPEIAREWSVDDRRIQQKARFFAHKHGLFCEDDPRAILLGPEAINHLNLFVHKFTLGLYFHVTKLSVPKNGDVTAAIWPKEVILEKGFPDVISDIMGPTVILKQGKWQTGRQFKYRTARDSELGFFARMSAFRDAFAVIDVVIHDLRKIDDRGTRSLFLDPTKLFSILVENRFKTLQPHNQLAS